MFIMFFFNLNYVYGFRFSLGGTLKPIDEKNKHICVFLLFKFKITKHNSRKALRSPLYKPDDN